MTNTIEMAEICRTYGGPNPPLCYTLFFLLRLLYFLHTFIIVKCRANSKSVEQIVKVRNKLYAKKIEKSYRKLEQ